jgi:hypothetical protein
MGLSQLPSWRTKGVSMPDFTITIECENAAWFEDAQSELDYVLAQVSAKALNCYIHSSTVLLDSNGNTTGKLVVA